MLARRFLRKNGGKLEARPEADRAGLCQPARLPANTRRTRMKAALALLLAPAQLLVGAFHGTTGAGAERQAGGRKEAEGAAAGAAVLEDRDLADIGRSADGRGPDSPGSRDFRQGLALHPRLQGRRDTGHRHGCRDRSGTAGSGAGVPAAYQPCEWPAGCAHAASFPPRSEAFYVLKGRLAAHPARHRPCRRRRRHERPLRRHAHGGVQRGYRRSRPARDVRRRRHTALLITGTIRVMASGRQ